MAYSSSNANNSSIATDAQLNLPPLDNGTITSITTTNAIPPPATTTTTTSTTLPSYATWPSTFPPPLSYRMYGPHTVPMPMPIPVPYMSPRPAIPPAAGNMVVQTTHTVRNNHMIRAKLHDKIAKIKKALAVGSKKSPRSAATSAATTTTTTQQTTTNIDGSTTISRTTRSTVPPPLAPLELPPLGAPLETITINTIPPLGAQPIETITTIWTPPALSPGVLSVPAMEDKLTVSSTSSTPSSTSESSPRLPDRILLSKPEDFISEPAADAEEAELNAELEAMPPISLEEIPPPPPVEGDEDNAPPAPAEIVQDSMTQSVKAQGSLNKSVIKGVQIVRQQQEEDSERIKRIDMRIAEITSANAIDDSDDADSEEEAEMDTQAMLQRAMDGLHETERLINSSLERTKVINVTHKAAMEVNDGRGGTKQAARVIQGSCSVSG